MGSDSRKESNAMGVELQIPPEVMKLVQHLKEVVDKNCTDSEIYDVLMECNMDPNEAVSRLLSQDSFKPVKNKRDRRKKMKETKESRARCNSGTAILGVRFGSEHAAGQTCSSKNNYNELGKTAYKREMNSADPSISSSSSYVYRATGKVINDQPSAHSESLNADNRIHSRGAGDAIFPSEQLPPGLQPTWLGVSKGHISMAEIVGGGRPQIKGSQMSSDADLPNSSYYHHKSPQVLLSPESELHQEPYASNPSSFSEMIYGTAMTGGRHDFDNEWPVIEHLPAATGSLVIDASAASDDTQIPERDFDGQNQSSGNWSASASSKQICATSAGRASNGDLLKETSSYDSQGHVSMHEEGMGNVSYICFPNTSASLNDDAISMSLATANLQHLNIGKEQPVVPPTEDHSAVVLPNHLQAYAADCSHLSFGTYNSGIPSSFPMAVASNLTESNLDVSAADGSSAVHSYFRSSEDCEDDQRGFMHDTERETADARNYGALVSSQPKLMEQDLTEATRRHQYISPLSAPDSSIKNMQQSGSNFPFVVNPTAKNLPSTLSETHSESRLSDSLALHNRSLRMRDPSPFFATQSMPSGYATAVSSINNHIFPMPEVLNSGSFPLPQLPPRAPTGSNLANRAVLPQRHPVHSFSQPILPLNELANMIAYPSMAQSQAYVPSALQQAYPESSRFHDPLAGMNYNLLRYRSSVTMDSLPLANDSTSIYRNIVQSSSNTPGSFPSNLSTSVMGNAVGYDDLHSHYQDRNSFTPHQQNNISSIWDFGVETQTMPMPSDSSHYSLPRQNQHRSRYQHDQQAPQDYESLGYPNTYHSERSTRTSTRRHW